MCSRYEQSENQNKMVWLILLAVCYSVVVGVINADEDPSEEKYQRIMEECENFNRPYEEEIYACFLLESKYVVDKLTDCAQKALSSTNVTMVDVIETICKDNDVFQKYIACANILNEEYQSNPEIREKMEVRQEALDCYDGVRKKYGLSPVWQDELKE